MNTTSAVSYVVTTRDVDGKTRRAYKTLKGARARFEEMLGYSAESAIAEMLGELADGETYPALEDCQVVKGVSNFGTVVRLECRDVDGQIADPAYARVAAEEPVAPALVGSRYVAIRVWGERLGSYEYYIAGQQRLAEKMQAPLDALYERNGIWTCVSDLKADHDFRKAYAQRLEILGLDTTAATAKSAEVIAAEKEATLPNTRVSIIENFEQQLVALRAALADGPDSSRYVLESQGLYIRVRNNSKVSCSGVLGAMTFSQWDAERLATQITNGNGLHPTPRTLPDAIRLSIAGLETCIESIRSIAA